MTDDGLTETQRAFLQSQYNREAFTDLSPAEINKLDMATYARLTGRQTPTQAAIQATGFEPPGRLRQEPAQTVAQRPADEPQGLDPNSPEYFHAWRVQRTRGGEGKGIFDSVGSRSDEYTAAVRSQAGRTGWSTSNVIESPRLDRAYVPEEQSPVYRSAQDRFYTPGNSYGA